VGHTSFHVCTTREREQCSEFISCVHDQKERVIERERQRQSVWGTHPSICARLERESNTVRKVERECVGHTSLNVCTTREREH